MEYLADTYRRFAEEFTDINDAYNQLASKCHTYGPLDSNTRRLVKLGIAIGLSSEGAVRSHVRRALEEGISTEEIQQVVILSLTTAGFPAALAAFKWMNEVIDARSTTDIAR